MNNILLKSYLKCKRKAWLDYKGDKRFKSWSAQNSIQLVDQYKNFKRLAKGNLFGGLKACEKGYKGVIGIKIKNNLKEGLNIEVFPPLLIKTKGQSKWGKYKYIPVVSKLGKKATREHFFDLALCSIVLENFAGVKIDSGLVISNFNNIFNIEKIWLNKNLKKKTINVFLEMVQSLKDNIPNITEDRKKCSICPWQTYCDKEAKSKGYLTDIDGIGKKTATILKNIGISDFKQLALSNKLDLDKKLAAYKEKNLERTSKFIDQSKSYSTGIPIRIRNNKNLSKIIFREKPGCYVFDIESNPDNKHDFLYGFLTIKNNNHGGYHNHYEPILNLKNDQNSTYIENIFKKLSSENEWPVIHYGDTEKIAIIKLAEKLSLNSFEINNLKSRFIDLHLLVRDNWILPVKNYSLKTVANWTGFKWKYKNVSGSKALFWWIQYNETKNQSFLRKIIEYNRDDCQATLNIANWLIKNHKNIEPID
ncbi:MAG: nuclease [Prochlorococcus sp. SP3034]|nr:nuclease [Prochlorococcus sp. SP3034]